MSKDSVKFILNDSIAGEESLAAYFDFNILGPLVHSSAESSSSETRTGIRLDGGNYSGYLGNQEPAFDTSKYTGFLLSSSSSAEADTASRTAIALPQEGGFRLDQSNLQFETTDLDWKDVSLILDFEFRGDKIRDGIIFGAFEKVEENVYDLGYQTGSKGFNVGVNSRGHLFVQAYDSNKDKILICSSELAKRNIISISSDSSSITLSHLDYINDEVTSVELRTEDNYLGSTDKFYLGGSKTYFASSDETTRTFSGVLNELAIFDRALSADYLMSIGSGFLGGYSFTAATTETTQRVTGYSEDIVYRTGVTGYEHFETGILTISTGREYISGASLSATSSEFYKEGERYYKYYTLNSVIDGSSSEIFYKEELGHLSPDETERYSYSPTGSDAFDTLGLQNISGSISDYYIESYTGQKTTTISLYGSRPLTGELNEISGVKLTNLTESVTSTLTEASSGIKLTGRAEDFLMNYIYYDTDRIS